MFSPIALAYLNQNPKLYRNDYANLTRIKEGRIQYPKRTTFLSETEKDQLSQDELLELEDACFVTCFDGVYSLILNMDLKANVKRHEFVIPDVVTGMVLNYQHYNSEAAPISVLVQEDMDLEAFVSRHQPDHISYYEKGVVYVYQKDQAQLLLESIKNIDTCYLADGHHRFLACQHLRHKDEVLTMVTNLKDAQIASIKRSMDLLEPFQTSIEYLAGEGFKECTGPLSKGVVEIQYKDTVKYYELQSMDQDVFGNHDVYRLHTQIISQGFKQYDSSQMIYGPMDDPQRVSFNTYPMSLEELVSFSDMGVVLPPKSTSIQPKSPSLLVMSLFSLK